MAINRFSNKNILIDSKQPIDHAQIYDDSILNKLDISNVSLTDSHFPPQSKIEYHIYSENNHLGGSEYPINTNINDGAEFDYTIDINPENDVRSNGVGNGNYTLVYNFLNTMISDMDMDSISADGTEIQLSISNPIDSSKLKSIYDFLNKPTDFKHEFALNFGNNEIEPIVGIYFDNNKRVGESVRDIQFPRTRFNQKDTRFYPTDSGDWVEVILPIQKSESESEQSLSETELPIEFITTGRTARFELIVNENNNIIFQQELDGNFNPIFYTDDADVEDRVSSISANLNLTDDLKGQPTYATVRYFDNSLLNLNGLTNIIVKLYRGISSGLENEQPSIDLVLRDSYIDRVLVYPTTTVEKQTDFSAPDFAIDSGNYGKSQGTSLKSWNDLLDTNQITSNQIVNNNFSSSFGNTKLNIDYTDFKNFVKYSSAVERVHNFKYKLQLIENYDLRISTLESISGSNAITNISQSMNRRDILIGDLDGWENWMYYESTGSLYTHYSSSAFTFEPWPKKSSSPTSFPLKLYTTTSSIAETYFNGLLSTASYYDSTNDSMLTKVTPSSIAEDDLNQDYLLFLNMIGQYFDVVWNYVNSLTNINSREEHPLDGMSDELLYNVASSMGWQLTHSKQRSELWRYFIGTDKSGNPMQSGSLASKSEKQMNSEVWRRIVNNIPHLLKTKGTRRSVKALMSMYGIPQSFLSIREYGGPVIDESETQLYWEHDKFVYHLNFDGDNYLKTVWDKTSTFNGSDYSFNEYKIPDAIELQFQQNTKDTVSLISKGSDFAIILEETGSSTNRGNIHFHLSGSSGYKSSSIIDVPLFDSKMSTIVIQRNVSTSSITTDNSYSLIYKRGFRDQLTVSTSSKLIIDGSTESSYNAAWTSSGDLIIGSGSLPTDGTTPSLWDNVGSLSGKIQELRIWENALIDSVITDHTLARNMYNGNTHTSSYFDLKMRFIPDSQLKSIVGTTGVVSRHPNQQISTTENGSIISASLYNFESDDLLGVTEEYYTRIPSIGANNIMTNKVRIDDNNLLKPLDYETSSEISLYDKSPVDTNQVGVYLSATQAYEEDIYNHTGFFKIDDYIGNPDNRAGFSETYRELDHLRRRVFKKYSTKNLINSIIDILSRYDLSVFEQIRQTMPARVDYNSGILIEPHILERPKFKSTSNISYTDLVRNVTLNPINREINTEFINLETEINVNTTLTSDYNLFETEIESTVDVVSERNDLLEFGVIEVVTPYNMATYKFTNLVWSPGPDIGYGINWVSNSNGYWNYKPMGVAITSSRVSKYALSRIFHFNTDESASLNIPYSSSLVPSQVSTDFLSLATANHKFNGCKITSDSITTNSPDTPDGKPVIEIFEADPNVLIYTSQKSNIGNIDVVAGNTLTTLRIDELHINKEIQFQNHQKYQNELNSFNTNISILENIELARIAEFDLMADIQLNRDVDDSKIRISVDYFIND